MQWNQPSYVLPFLNYVCQRLYEIFEWKGFKGKSGEIYISQLVSVQRELVESYRIGFHSSQLLHSNQLEYLIVENEMREYFKSRISCAINLRQKNKHVLYLHKPIIMIVKEVHLQVRAMLLGLDRERIAGISPQRHPVESYLSTWFDRFQA
ncbi:hypothetical protein YC2023_037816 [Brassica napus]